MTMINDQPDVVILCGGLGTRLRTVVSDRPKPMAEVDGRPFVHILVDHVASFGYRRFILCAGYKAETIKEYFKTATMPVEVVVSIEPQPMGTGGALKHAAGLLKSDDVIVMNGDSFCAVDYAKLIDEHRARQADVTITAVQVKAASEFGSMRVDKSGRVTAFSEKQGGGQGLVNAGVYVFRRAAIETMPLTIPLSLEKDVFPKLTASRLFAHLVRGPLLDIGTPESYEKARQDLLRMMR